MLSSAHYYVGDRPVHLESQPIANLGDQMAQIAPTRNKGNTVHHYALHKINSVIRRLELFPETWCCIQLISPILWRQRR